MKVRTGLDRIAHDDDAQRLVRGARVGLVAHPASVDRHLRHATSVLHHAGARVERLFGPEHGIYGKTAASVNIADTTDKRTGLPAYSLYGNNRKPTQKQLQGVDALLIDMQDIGVRSYTFSVCMKYAMEACFEYGVEVIILDRPNPLGGLKVDGPLLDRQFFSGVGSLGADAAEGGIAFGAHVVGFIAGAVLGLVRRGSERKPPQRWDDDEGQFRRYL